MHAIQAQPFSSQQHRQGAIIKRLKTDCQCRRLFKISTVRGTSYVKPDDIRYVKAKGNYTVVRMVDETQHILSLTLSKVTKQLAGHHFLRIHQSYLVNARCISSIQKTDGQHWCELDDESHLPIARRRIKSILNSI